MMIDWITIEKTLWSTRPAMIDPRCTGDIRNRSTTPRSMSEIMLMPPQPAPKRAVIMTTPGARNWMYEVEWKPGISTTRLNSAP